MNRKFHITPYTLKSLNLDPDAFLELAQTIGYDGIEVSGCLQEEYAAKAASRGLAIVHAGLPFDTYGWVDEDYVTFLKYQGVRDVAAINASLANQMQSLFRELHNPDNLSFRYRGIPGAFGTREAALRAAEAAGREAATAAEYGLRIIYHNHTHEYRVEQGEYIMDTYLANTPDNVVMQLDVGWALCAGVDVIAWMKRWPGRIASLHVKPCNWVIGPEALGMTCPLPGDDEGITRDHMQAIQAYAESPQGPMELNICDWTSIFEAAEAAGCTTFIHERERIYLAGGMLDCVKADYRHIRHCLDNM